MKSTELQIEDLGRALNKEIEKAANTELTKYANEVVAIFRKAIREAGAEASHSLSQSVEPVIKDGNVEVLANYYYKFVDKGVSGVELKRPGTPYAYRNKKPPMKAMQTWLGFKGEGLSKSRAYAVRENVYKYGIRGRGFMKIAYKRIDKIKI